ncbi:zeta-carotene desaturase [Nitzschia inconspicua]|uniref:Zeta-carotene desaturase n=1 Tax=Nitzschia inconspicua TaxID=303405 RepID=A0A9K3KTD6_9STRA|nr:zeta-carotene desaturase [Nitzschia inconspicua]
MKFFKSPFSVGVVGILSASHALSYVIHTPPSQEPRSSSVLSHNSAFITYFSSSRQCRTWVYSTNGDANGPSDNEANTDEVNMSSSADIKWKKQQTELEEQNSSAAPKKRIAIVGGGWGGWGAAKAICESRENVEVILLDALPDPTGKTPFLSKTGKPVEAGTRGFWKDYPNINSLCAELGLKESDVFTPFTNSSFYSPDGLEATAPVFSEGKIPEINLPILSQLSGQTFPQLPSPLGQVLATFPLFERIPLQDRASMIGLLIATVDCLGNDVKVQEKYDRMSAQDLFILFGLSERLVEDFIKPTLLVGLFKPPEELSALVVMELLYYYALAHQDSFDVRWIKNGTVSDSLISPLATYLQEHHGLIVKGGSFVSKISLDKDNSKTSIEYKTRDGTVTTLDVDGIVLALNGKGMASVMESSPDLSQYSTFSKAASLKNGIDVISTRIWLDRYIKTRTPANVFSRFDALRGSGGTFFMLDQFQADNELDLWGGETPQGSVLACDFYNAGALMSLSDEKIIDILMKDLLPEAVAEFAFAEVKDSWVGKFPGSVSFFSPGSFTRRPPLQGDPNVPNIKFAGDWVRMGDMEHGAKGLCQERAYVSGLQAGNLLLDEIIGKARLYKHPVIPVREDEAQFKAAVALNKRMMKVLPRFWVR